MDGTPCAEDYIGWIESHVSRLMTNVGWGTTADTHTHPRERNYRLGPGLRDKSPRRRTDMVMWPHASVRREAFCVGGVPFLSRSSPSLVISSSSSCTLMHGMVIQFPKKISHVIHLSLTVCLAYMVDGIKSCFPSKANTQKSSSSCGACPSYTHSLSYTWFDWLGCSQARPMRCYF
jgi:hypothetical protein